MSLTRMRALPSVDRVLALAPIAELLRELPRSIVLEAVRAQLAIARAALKANKREVPPDPEVLAAQVIASARAAARPQLVRVLNATGIVLHTNLGRAPLPESARRAVAEVAAGYSSLEYDLDAGKRGDRGAGIERWLTRLTGAEAAMAVNNGAAAVMVVLSAVATGRKVLVSRGELVEIGGSFRVPEIMEKSGAVLVEVGATNRTHLRDYEKAFEKHDDIAAILRVHPSNFRVQGFTARPELAALAKLAHHHRVAMIEDLGSGALVDLAPYGLEHEPTVAESLAAGVDLLTCSGDKLLGGAQAGLILGTKRWVQKVRKDPFARAMRVDKLALAALEATLALYADPARAAEQIPTLVALRVSRETLVGRAERLGDELRGRVPQLQTRLVEGHGEVGGGAMPLEKLKGPVVELTHPTYSAAELERRARRASPPIIGTVRNGHFRLDPRTLSEAEVGMLAIAFAKVLNAGDTP